MKNTKLIVICILISLILIVGVIYIAGEKDRDIKKYDKCVSTGKFEYQWNVKPMQNLCDKTGDLIICRVYLQGIKDNETKVRGICEAKYLK